MAFIFSFEARDALRRLARSAAEGGVLAVLASVVLWAVLKPFLLRPALAGIFAALSAATVSVALLLGARLWGRGFPSFMKAWGAGLFLRAAVLAALMAGTSGRHPREQGAVLASYALGVTFLLLLEYRQLATGKG